jgi:hypothetical protein
MKGFLILYSPKTGQILQSMESENTPEDRSMFDNVDHVWKNESKQVLYIKADDVDPSEHWIESGKLQKKREFPKLKFSNGKINNIPTETSVIWPDKVLTVESGSLEFDCNVSGVFSFVFYSARYKEYTLEVTYNV